ncbi:hypothetical protein EIN_153680 [Entamoeba invadens IP1]|uniref:Uncharacterized protein n=1 Tax=Entamoeba invadens IP1 TaxID=370355 RepID=A0A0A1UET2_ENTIV|nr:hypothetical protein EIN_153680 [Entamoeba invadens IP1]ELP91331.1 hypothetical protein EIN_153680 [Entamoeba invadens IP1]|eukprot:XP_004258102.1 hypothetical protein EIN_153680 [Entamoeba invadens IP1]
MFSWMEMKPVVVLKNDYKEGETIFSDEVLLPIGLYDKYVKEEQKTKNPIYVFLYSVGSEKCDFIGRVVGRSSDVMLHFRSTVFSTEGTAVLQFKVLDVVKSISIKPLSCFFYTIDNYRAVLNGLFQRTKCLFGGQRFFFYTPSNCGIEIVNIEISEVNGKADGCAVMDGQIFDIVFDHIFTREQIYKAIEDDKKEANTKEKGTVECKYCKLEMKKKELRDHIWDACDYSLEQCECCELYYPIAYKKLHRRYCLKYLEKVGIKEKVEEKEEEKENTKVEQKVQEEKIEKIGSPKEKEGEDYSSALAFMEEALKSEDEESDHYEENKMESKLLRPTSPETLKRVVNEKIPLEKWTK